LYHYNDTHFLWLEEKIQGLVTCIKKSLCIQLVVHVVWPSE